MRQVVALMAAVVWLLPGTACRQSGPPTVGTGAGVTIERDVLVPMRDGVRLQADIWRPAGDGPFPVLVYRTPYDRRLAAEGDTTHVEAVRRGYAVVLQDVRGRYGSEGEFDPYRNEGRDGYDTIEWAAVQPWSNGRVGSYGLSYPGAVQWLAAVESPPHLVAMVPAMTFSTPRNFFYSGGVFDGSWLDWILLNIAPDLRRRHDIPGPRTYAEASVEWDANKDEWRRTLPLGDFESLRAVAPFFFEWLRHPPNDPWWDWAELRNKYDRVDAAVLNISGWHDEAYGPEGAATNFNGLVDGRAGDARTGLVLGPWVHGGIDESRVGELELGPAAALDYDDLVLDWLDRFLLDATDEYDTAPVRYFVMGENAWREADAWPPPAETTALYLRSGGDAGPGLADRPEAAASSSTEFVADPLDPVVDPHAAFGPHDYSRLAARADVLVFDSTPLERTIEVSGPIEAEIFLSCDCPDVDLWVKVLDVHPDGRAFNLMSSGLDVQRASFSDAGHLRQLLEAGEIYALRLDRLMTSNRFEEGHRIRVQISASFFPRFSRNLQTGRSEAESSETRLATVTIHHDESRRSRILLPVVPD